MGGGGSKAKEKGNMKGERRVEGGYVWKRKRSRYKTAYIYKHGGKENTEYVKLKHNMGVDIKVSVFTARSMN